MDHDGIMHDDQGDSQISGEDFDHDQYLIHDINHGPS